MILYEDIVLHKVLIKDFDLVCLFYYLLILFLNQRKMSSFLQPGEMNTVQKMKYNSTISKVCKEMESQLGISEKTIAEVYISI